MKLSLILITLFSFTSLAWNIPPQPKEAAYLYYKNKIVNPGFENGTSQWTASGGSFTVTTTAADLAEGSRSAVFDASASAQTLSSSNYTIERGLRQNNAYAKCRVRTTATDYILDAYDGTNILASQTLQATTEFSEQGINFVFPTSGTARIRIRSQSDAAAIYVDDCYLGSAPNIQSASRSQFVGSSYFTQTTNCSWSRTNTAIGAFNTDADCPGPTIGVQRIGTWQTTDADLPRQTINSLPEGLYEVTVTGSLYGGGDWTMAVSDGTTTSPVYCSGSGNGAGTFQPATSCTAWFEYTTSGNRSFEIYGSSSSGAISLDNNANNDRTSFSIRRWDRYPSTFASINNTDFGWTRDDALVTVSAGFGTVTNKYVYKRRVGDTLYVKGSFEAGTVAASNAFLDIVGVTIDTTKVSTNTNSFRVGEYTLKQSGSTSTTNPSNFGHADLFFDGSDTDSIYFATQTNADQYIKFNPSGTFGNTDSFSFEFTIPVVGWSANQSTPVFVGSISSNSTGALRMERALVSAACAASPCTIASGNESSWLTNITRDGTGDYNLNFASGVFSAAPTCFVWPVTNTGVLCHGSDAPSTTLQQFVCRNTAMTTFDSAFSIQCMGPR